MKTIRVIAYLMLISGFLIGVQASLRWSVRHGWTRTYTDRIVEAVNLHQNGSDTQNPEDTLEDRVASLLEEFNGKLVVLYVPTILGPALMLAGGLILARRPWKQK